MPIHNLSNMTWTEVAALPRDRTVAILPLGAIEAHGPHLPLDTDGILAEGMAEAASVELEGSGLELLLLPTLTYSAAPFAAGFAGTLSIRPETSTALIVDIVRALWEHGFERIALANSHFDPGHLRAVYRATESLAEEAAARRIPAVVFPDVTRRSLAGRLTEEFQSGACHAGRYEGSMVMARRPNSVRLDLQKDLPELPISLSSAIRKGSVNFEAIGADQAYVGNPSAATAAEGQQTLRELGRILADAILAASTA